MRTNYLFTFCFWSIMLLFGLNLHAQVPEMIQNINPTGNSSAVNFFEYNGLVFFRANNGTTGQELWQTDGTATNTSGFDINPSGNSFPANYVIYDGKMYFEADNGPNGDELFVYDGTGSPTMVEDLNMGSGNSDPTNFVVFNGALYFEANNGTTGDEIYKYDGMSITLVADIQMGEDDSGISNTTLYNNAIYFEADNGTDGDQLFKIDANDQVTQYVINSEGDANPNDFIVYNNKLYFNANDGSGDQLFVYDGTGNPTKIGDELDPDDFAVYGGELYFSGVESTSGQTQLLKYNDGTGMVIHISGINDSEDVDPQRLTVLGNLLIFSANDGTNGREPWVYNGTDNPTLLKDIRTDAGGGSVPFDFTVAKDKLYFRANEGTGGGSASRLELWETDGTSDGTKRATTERINDGANAAVNNIFFSEALSTLFFAANDGTNGTEPWRYVIAPILGVSQASNTINSGDTYNFAETQIISSTEIIFTLENTGNTTLNINSIEASGDGFEVIGVVPTMITAGGSEPITLTFASDNSGDKTGTLTIISDDLENPSFEINLSGLITSLEQIIAESLNIYPNPSQHEVQLDWAKMPFREVTLQVRDAKGNALIRQTLQASQNTQSLDLSALSSGVYFVELITEQGRATRRIVKQ